MKLALLGDASHTNIQRWCEGLQHHGVDLHVISFTPGDTTWEQLYPLPLRWQLGTLNYFAAAPHVRRLLREIRPDLLLAYFVTGYGLLGALTQFHPLVLLTSGSDILLPRSPVMRRIQRFTLKRGDLVTAWAPHMAAAAERLGVPQTKLFVLARGIPVQAFAAHRSPPPQRGDVLKMVSTRALRPIYRLDVLIRAVGRLRQHGVPFELTIVGRGPQLDELRALVGEIGLERQVHFSGYVRNDELPAVLARHNTYVSLSPSDGVSASLLEAMAVGLTPIVVDHPANRQWLVDGENGILLGSLTLESIADALGRASQAFDLRQAAWERNAAIVRERADMFENARRYVARFEQLRREMVASESRLAGVGG
jgi:glycosyltransferase involved in cell wall biosynthesis